MDKKVEAKQQYIYISKITHIPDIWRVCLKVFFFSWHRKMFFLESNVVIEGN